jgi:L-amino acid N-acyltransferase YncA
MATFFPATAADLPAIKEIYDHYILFTTATFHEVPVPVDGLAEYVPVNDPRHPSLVIHSGARSSASAPARRTGDGRRTTGRPS